MIVVNVFWERIKPTFDICLNYSWTLGSRRDGAVYNYWDSKILECLIQLLSWPPDSRFLLPELLTLFYQKPYVFLGGKFLLLISGRLGSSRTLEFPRNLRPFVNLGPRLFQFGTTEYGIWSDALQSNGAVFEPNARGFPSLFIW